MKERSYRYILLVILFIGFMGSCYYDNEATLYPGNCVTDLVTYQGYVKPFIDINCTCHVKGSKNGNVSLDGYLDCKASVTSGKLIMTIRHDAGVSAMPPSSSKTGTCEINKLESWITAGALNN